MTHTLQEIAELGKPHPRYGIGIDEENGELLIEDHAKHTLIARTGSIARPLIEDMLRQANAAPVLAARLLRIGEIIKPELLSIIETADEFPLADDEFMNVEISVAHARELLAILTPNTKE